VLVISQVFLERAGFRIFRDLPQGGPMLASRLFESFQKTHKDVPTYSKIYEPEVSL